MYSYFVSSEKGKNIYRGVTKKKKKINTYIIIKKYEFHSFSVIFFRQINK